MFSASVRIAHRESQFNCTLRRIESFATMTEAELAIEEKLRKKREEQEQIWQEYLEQREKQRQKEEDDLRKLKERQVSYFWF